MQLTASLGGIFEPRQRAAATNPVTLFASRLPTSKPFPFCRQDSPPGWRSWRVDNDAIGHTFQTVQSGGRLRTPSEPSLPPCIHMSPAPDATSNGSSPSIDLKLHNAAHQMWKRTILWRSSYQTTRPERRMENWD